MSPFSFTKPRTRISLADFASKLAQAVDVDLPAAHKAEEEALARLRNLETTSKKKNYNLLSARLQKSETRNSVLCKSLSLSFSEKTRCYVSTISALYLFSLQSY